MSWSARATWRGYPTAASIHRWAVRLDADHSHVVAEGIRP